MTDKDIEITLNNPRSFHIS